MRTKDHLVGALRWQVYRVEIEEVVDTCLASCVSRRDWRASELALRLFHRSQIHGNMTVRCDRLTSVRATGG
jgi:hypothetical protein